MLNIKKYLLKQIKYQEDTVTATTSASYDGYFYADVMNVVPSGSHPTSAIVVSSTDNKFATVTMMGRSMRVWSRAANITVAVRITYALDAQLGG